MTVDILYNMKREMLRRKLSPRTVKTYLFNVKKFLLANKDKSPKECSPTYIQTLIYNSPATNR